MLHFPSLVFAFVVLEAVVFDFSDRGLVAMGLWKVRILRGLRIAVKEWDL